MINLEWLRTFRVVYKTQSTTKASERLLMSQPAVSQHIAALESHVGKKLFIRKSKGVEPTDHGRLLNNQVASAFDELEEVEESFRKISPKKNIITSIGISEHLYSSILAPHLNKLGAYVHVSFGSTEALVKAVESGSLTYAIIPGEVNTFDTICRPLFKQRLMLVYTKDVEMDQFTSLYQEDKRKCERWLSKLDWYSHRSITPYIKQYWMVAFDKKRPSIVPKLIVPNESEVLAQLAVGSGVALTFDTTARSFLEQGKLDFVSLDPTVERTVSLITNQKKIDQEQFQFVLETLSENQPGDKVLQV